MGSGGEVEGCEGGQDLLEAELETRIVCVCLRESSCRGVQGGAEGKEQSIINELSLGYQFAWNLTVLAHKIPCPGKPLVLGKLG